MQTIALTIAIMGGGLSGSFLAAYLVERGCRVLLFEDPQTEATSYGAAGLYNVITGRRMSLTWGASQMVDTLNHFFASPLGQPLAQYRKEWDVYRPYADAEGAQNWIDKFLDAEYRPWILQVPKPIAPEQYRNPHGGFVVKGVGRLLVADFLVALKKQLAETGRFEALPARIEYNSIDPEARIFTASGKTWPFDGLVFCEGIAALQNPFWNIRPLYSLKGQVLRIRVQGLRTSEVWVGEGVFVLPDGGDCFTVGSTYETHFDHPHPTPEGREHLLTCLQRLVPALESSLETLAVESHWAGLRPSTADRLPLAGQHNTFPALYFLNGMGSKGVLQAPMTACGLADAIATGTTSLHPAFEFYRRVMTKKLK